MNFLPLIFLLIKNKDTIVKLWEAIQPLLPLLKGMIDEIKPQIEQPPPEEPLIFDVQWVQETLNLLGEKLEVDGEMGPDTEAAVRRFQAKHKLDVDGDPGAVTRAWLFAERQKL